MRGRSRPAAALLLLPLLLSACAGAPQSRETGFVLEAGVLGAEPAEEGIRLYAAARREEGADSMTRGTGPAPAAAAEALEQGGEAPVSCVHGEHLLLARSGEGLLPDLLSFAFQDPRQSTETLLWAVETDSLAEIFGPDRGLVRRMDVLRAAGDGRQGFRSVPLREAAAAEAMGLPVLLPALRPEGESLIFSGAAVWDRGRFTAWLDREEALGAFLLLGGRVRWTESALGETVSLRAAGCRLDPVWRGERLTGLTAVCRLEGVRTGGWPDRPLEARRLEVRTEERLARAMIRLRAAGAGDLLLRRAGLSRPWQWSRLAGQRGTASPGVTLTARAELTGAASGQP